MKFRKSHTKVKTYIRFKNATNENQSLNEKITIGEKEIETYQKILNEYGITFSSLVKQSPSDVTTKKFVNEVVKKIIDSETFSSYLTRNKRLPINELVDFSLYPKQAIKTYQKYIMAIALIYIENLPTMARYLNLLENE